MNKSISLLLLFLILLPGFLITAQSKENVVYWFTCKLIEIIDPNLHTPVFKFKEVSSQINSGSNAYFIKAYKGNLTKNKITIGPFEKNQNAEFGRKYYEQLSHLSEIELAKEIKNQVWNENVYYFTSDFEKKESPFLVNFKRTAAAVANGYMFNFTESLHEALIIKNILIGPFSSHPEAEIAKFYQRRYGEKKSFFSNLSNTKHSLNKMAEGFNKSVIPGLTFSIDSLSLIEDTVRISLFFPKKYFHKSALLVLSADLIFQDTTINYSMQNITLQGEKVQDNNIVVRYDFGDSFTLKIICLPNIKIEKLVLKTLFLNNKHLIKGEDIKFSCPIKEK